MPGPALRHIAVTVLGLEGHQFSKPFIPIAADLIDDLRRNGVTQRIE